ncbi:MULTISPECIES: isopropylmalate synthase [unclassified Brenneria]|uniref:isopropylmalate synthase n=1 Tax=unclassified Brenneria TaxID=2634434 RepID=UPI0018F0EE4F|nr:isopropylmalate synthase [Brenneria sp. L3-3C-1]MBJ7223568.1 isopropylmalate synthase [Brenneria sp. L3-3C-1]MEE3644810.1 isopropylmalate synthase [Brenneria sp. L3_3C_1]
MALLKFPDNHTPRYCDFSIDGILDETLREGAERCAFSVPAQDKIPLISKILQSGVRDIVYGSGPKDPTYLIQTINDLEENGGLPAGTRFSFIMLLNCHEPIMPQFESFPDALKDHLTISFGMVSHKSDEQLFERTTGQLRAWGFNSFRVSLLNNFSTGIDEESYEKITRDIDRSIAQDIQTVRINDSLGTLYPEAMAVLAANLRHQYPDTDFCLHAHNDRGLGLQNALASLYHGFNIIEGGFAGTGNRSGLPAIEILDLIFKERNITINQHSLDSAAVVEAARLSERTFLSMPDLYRPVSGHIVNQENMGVANIPAFLGAARDIPYFLNSTGLHDATVQRILQDEGLEPEANDDATVQLVKQKLDAILTDAYTRKHEEFERIRGELIRFYTSDVLYAATVGQYARDFIE